MSTAWAFNRSQLQGYLERFVAEGPGATRAQRQAEADGALMVLDSDAFTKARREDPAPAPHGPMLTTGQYSPPKEG
jgi:hypothetical protein